MADEPAFPRHPNAVGPDDAFYVGWQPVMPAPFVALVRPVVIALALLLALGGAALATQATRGQPGVFEFGQLREYEGVLYERPVPALRVPAPGGEGAVNLLLVGFGKFGLPPQARGHHGERVRFRGTVISQGGVTMIEISDADSFTAFGEATRGEQRPPPVELGEVTLVGELVDTKCYLGVMRPGFGKVHRGCATRCLSGGVPPGLLVRHGGDYGTVILLAGPGGAPLEFDPRWAGLPVRVVGALQSHEGTPALLVSEMTLAEGGA
ncbi:MAG: hypothetical protein KC636_40100 [Myxococcales bacterium]|nr:hypothetical protein [Myxococcales bacterium]